MSYSSKRKSAQLFFIILDKIFFTHLKDSIQLSTASGACHCLFFLGLFLDRIKITKYMDKSKQIKGFKNTSLLCPSLQALLPWFQNTKSAAFWAVTNSVHLLTCKSIFLSPPNRAAFCTSQQCLYVCTPGSDRVISLKGTKGRKPHHVYRSAIASAKAQDENRLIC